MRGCDNPLIIAACNRWCRRCGGDSPGGRRKGGMFDCGNALMC